MVVQVQDRVAFGKRLVDQSSIQQDIAKSRIEIELCRLLVLKAAHVIDCLGNKVSTIALDPPAQLRSSEFGKVP